MEILEIREPENREPFAVDRLPLTDKNFLGKSGFGVWGLGCRNTREPRSERMRDMLTLSGYAHCVWIACFQHGCAAQ
ncbi:hypothetical protein IX53_05940 [Kosmotoga pacifica]|uniref:Uncharacterized protein n=1 Tax=Kosmotoga pacifica TaxID=1330330 RepID=A0A0G2Z781_9BACT|nr:hypothetical protein IX53_05940 [Kosmotoga pacifica]